MNDNDIIKPCGVVCGDNRFELIKKYKQMLFEQTNIETAKDQVAVIDDILFRFWQMGWLDKLEEFDRKDAEVERLQKEKACYHIALSCANDVKPLREKRIQSEAIKEFTSEFEKRCIAGGIYPAFVKRQLDNVKKKW